MRVPFGTMIIPDGEHESRSDIVVHAVESLSMLGFVTDGSGLPHIEWNHLLDAIHSARHNRDDAFSSYAAQY